MLCQNWGLPGSKGQENLVSKLQLCLTEEMTAVTPLSLCLRTTNSMQTQVLSIPRTHKDVPVWVPELCCAQCSQPHCPCRSRSLVPCSQHQWGCCILPRSHVLNCPALPHCPSHGDGCPGAGSEAAAGVGGCSQPWFSSRSRIRALCWSSVPSSTTGTSWAEQRLPSHLENMIHANYGGKKALLIRSVKWKRR